MSRDDDDLDIDVCIGCGRYYSPSQWMKDTWRAHARPGEVMPQQCHRCYTREHPEDMGA